MDITEKDCEYMRLALRQMRRTGIEQKTGGPFGAVIVREGHVLAVAGNSVIKDNDPTAHAEMNAIRQACRVVGSFDLSGATLYTSCECCPMCYAAAYWARISQIYYAASWQDYHDLFDDMNIQHDMQRPYDKRLLHPCMILRDEALTIWQEYRDMQDKVLY
jgi:tRNA(Arg) A34 adenosine deaminase TadA